MTILDYIIEGPDMSEKGRVDVAGIVDNIANQMCKPVKSHCEASRSAQWPPKDWQ